MRVALIPAEAVREPCTFALFDTVGIVVAGLKAARRNGPAFAPQRVLDTTLTFSSRPSAFRHTIDQRTTFSVQPVALTISLSSKYRRGVRSRKASTACIAVPSRIWTGWQGFSGLHATVASTRADNAPSWLTRQLIFRISFVSPPLETGGNPA